jgi:predicted porin
MKRSIIFISLAALGFAAAAQSSVSISGGLKVAVARGNGGTTPMDGNGGNKTAMNDHSSYLMFSGKEDLGGGYYAGFALANFTQVDSGTVSAPYFARQSVVKLGGDFGEVYMGRALTPAALMVLFADPWYWDASAAQVGWQIQQANYTSTAYVRTDNTVGYTSPNFNGFTLSLAGSAGEGKKSNDVGFSLNYNKGPVWLGAAYDRSKGFFNSPTMDHMAVVAGGYDFGVVRPLVSVTSSEVGGVKYKAYSVALTAPVGNGVLKAAYAHLDDFDTTTVAREALGKIGLGYQYNLSKRTNVFTNVSQAKGQTRSATRTVEFGVEHNF